MSELESHDDVEGKISQRKILIFASILVLLSLLVFGGITAILTSKHTSDKSTPTTAPMYYYGNPVMDEDLTAAEKATKALSDPNAPGKVKIDITVDKDNDPTPIKMPKSK